MWLSLQTTEAQASEFDIKMHFFGQTKELGGRGGGGGRDGPVGQPLRGNHGEGGSIRNVLPFQFYGGGAREIFVVEFHVITKSIQSKLRWAASNQGHSAQHDATGASGCLQSICNGENHGVGVHNHAVGERVSAHSKQQQTHQ